MFRILRMLVLFALTLAAGCANGNGPVNYTPTPGWPAAVNDLGRLIAQKQRDVVKPGGNIYQPNYSAADQASFDSSNRLQQIVSDVEKSPTFINGVATLKSLPTATQQQVLSSFAQPEDKT